MQPELMKTRELVALLKVSEPTVRKLAREGKIPGRVRLGQRSIRYRRELVQRWLEAGCPGVVREGGAE